MEEVEQPIKLLEGVEWHRSSLATTEGAVEVAIWAGGVAVRDAKDKDTGPALLFDWREWEAFTGGVRGGEFDLPKD